MTAEDIRRIQRIARERAEGTYEEWSPIKLRELIDTRDAGLSVKRVRNPHITPATPQKLAVARAKQRHAKHNRNVPAALRPRSASLRNKPCPCGSGRKAKYCCKS